MNILDWWEKGKKSIKDITINYSKVMATKEKYKYKGLIQELEEEENKDKNDISNERINKIKKEIAILEDNRKKRSYNKIKGGILQWRSRKYRNF